MNKLGGILMKDINKDKEYFLSYLDYQYERIRKKTEKLRNCENNEIRQRILVSLTGYEIDLLKAEYSIGASKEDIKVLFYRAIDLIKGYHKISRGDLLSLLSLSILLDVKYEIHELIENNKEMIKQNRLLNCLATYLESGNIEWNTILELEEENIALNYVFEQDDKIKLLKEYHNNWYNNHKNYAWYDSHLSDMDTYCGYWSFESAAVAKMLNLEESDLKGMKYYPVL